MMKPLKKMVLHNFTTFETSAAFLVGLKTLITNLALFFEDDIRIMRLHQGVLTLFVSQSLKKFHHRLPIFILGI